MVKKDKVQRLYQGHPNEDALVMYLQLRYYGDNKRYSHGWAWKQMIEHYGIICPRDWLDYEPLEPSGTTELTIRRWRIQYHKAKQAGKKYDRKCAQCGSEGWERIETNGWVKVICSNCGKFRRRVSTPPPADDYWEEMRQIYEYEIDVDTGEIVGG